MAAPLIVSIPHRLSREEAVRRLREGMHNLPQSNLVAVEPQPWSGDRMAFTVRALGQSVPGSLEVLDQAVRIEVMLPGLLQKLWEPLKTVLLGRTKALLEKK